MNTTEVWKDIEGYEGYYQISNMGRVRSLDRGMFVEQDRYEQPRWMKRSGRILQQHPDGKGYPMVRLCREGKVKQIVTHRLVAIHFIPNPESKPAVNHIDSNPLNNSQANLEWCTITENNQHAVRMGRKPHIIKSTFNKAEREALCDLFDAGVGVTAVAKQLGLPYHAVRYIYRLHN